ncbi:FxLD family lanthipeptide [Streptomyces sp. NPDC127084]|uniref:FxLD family lanthipeptide n=1 Tax=Streptomyces sp. NPDC127084 TaxID=3347133 RepID=UPI003667E2B3
MDSDLTNVNPQATSQFDLDVTVLELADTASLVNLTDDNCGSTCGACNSTVA